MMVFKTDLSVFGIKILILLIFQNMKTILIFFGSKGYEKSKQRLYLSAKNYFDKIISYSEEDIEPSFYNANIKIFSQRRVGGIGYGNHILF